MNYPRVSTPWQRDLNGNALPRVIRKVSKRDRNGRAKVARDRKTHLTLERITARTAKPCQAPGCRRQGSSPDEMGMITPGEEFARVTYGASRIGYHLIPMTANYHVKCVPEKARPLVRFLWPNALA